MLDAVRFAGYMAAGAVVTLYNNRNITPQLAYADGQGKMGREALAEEDPTLAVERGRRQLAQGAEGLVHAVFMYEGEFDFEGAKGDAVFLEVRTYGESPAALFMAVPYRRTTQLQVFRPKFLAVEQVEEKDLPVLSQGFFHGIENHEDGATIWSASMTL